MNHLLRELAPITDRGWEELDEEARSQLVVTLAARKLIDFSGPHGWERSATNLGRTEPLLSAKVIALLEGYSWPGNIRELKNAMERAVLLCMGSAIEPEHLQVDKMTASPPFGLPRGAVNGHGADSGPALAPHQADERQRIIDALGACAGNQSRAAKMLGMPRRTFISKLDAYGIPRPQKKGLADEKEP